MSTLKIVYADTLNLGQSRLPNDAFYRNLLARESNLRLSGIHIRKGT